MDDDIRARARARRQTRTRISLPEHTPRNAPSTPRRKVSNIATEQQAAKPIEVIDAVAKRPLRSSSIVTSNPQGAQSSNRPSISAGSRRGALLSSRQRIVIEAFVKGLSNNDIKEVLPKLNAEVTKETISNYFSNVIGKIAKEKNFEGSIINRCRAILYLLENNLLCLNDYAAGVDEFLNYDLNESEQKMLLMFAAGMHDINIARQLQMKKPKFDELKHGLQKRFKAKTIERVLVISLLKGLIPDTYKEVIAALESKKIEPSNRAIKVRPAIDSAENAGIIANLCVDNNLCKLSRMEMNILLLLSVGFKVKNIAKEMDITESVIYTHRDNMMKKLRVKTFNQAMRKALKEGLIEYSFDPQYISPSLQTLSFTPEELRALSEVNMLEDKTMERTYITENQETLKSLGNKFNLKEKFDCLRASDILYMFNVECLRVGIAPKVERANLSLSN